jgi:hypothetical protein
LLKIIRRLAWAAAHDIEREGSGMVQVHRYSLALIYLILGVAGMFIGYRWSVGGSILGTLLGAVAASGVAIMLNTPERMEAAFYGIQACAVSLTLIFLIVTFWGVRL